MEKIEDIRHLITRTLQGSQDSDLMDTISFNGSDPPHEQFGLRSRSAARAAMADPNACASDGGGASSSMASASKTQGACALKFVRSAQRYKC